MGIIETILTIFAWRNGWKWKALIPMVTVFIIGFMLGILQIFDIAILFDILGSIALIIMIIQKPKEVKEPTTTNVEETKKTE
jgi:uncharacterized membrane protein YfcA